MGILWLERDEGFYYSWGVFVLGFWRFLNVKFIFMKYYSILGLFFRKFYFSFK